MRELLDAAIPTFRTVLTGYGRNAPAFQGLDVGYRVGSDDFIFTVAFTNGHNFQFVEERWKIRRMAQAAGIWNVTAADLQRELTNGFAGLYRQMRMDMLTTPPRRTYSFAPNPLVEQVQDREFTFSALNDPNSFTISYDTVEAFNLTATEVSAVQRRLMDEAVRVTQQVFERHLMQTPVSPFIDDDGGYLVPTRITRLRDDVQVHYMGGFEYSVSRASAPSKDAVQKGMKLLKEWLTPDQLAQFEKDGHFDVIGATTGKRYRIKHGRQQNIHELDQSGRPVRGLCFLPDGDLVEGDCMLAQKLALEINEREALAVAREFISFDPSPRWGREVPVQFGV